MQYSTAGGIGGNKKNIERIFMAISIVSEIKNSCEGSKNILQNISCIPVYICISQLYA